MSKKTTTPYKFYVVIKKSTTPVISDIFEEDNTYEYQYYALIKGLNHETVFAGETRRSKSGLIKTINRLFPNVKIVDKAK